MRVLSIPKLNTDTVVENNPTSSSPQTRYRVGRSRTKRDQLKRVEGLFPERQGQNLAVTVLDVPYSLDSGQQQKRKPNENTVGFPDRSIYFRGTNKKSAAHRDKSREWKFSEQKWNLC